MSWHSSVISDLIMCSGSPYAKYVESGGKLNFVEWMKEGSGANVFDFASLLSTAPEGGAGPHGLAPLSI